MTGEVLISLLERHKISAVLLLLSLITICSIVVAKQILKRRWKRLVEAELAKETELDTLPPLGPLDDQARDRIKAFRREVWDLPEAQLELTIEALTERGFRIVRAVAEIYHSDASIPQYEASLLELLQLMRRVATRLHRLASVMPFRFLGTRKLSDYQRYYQVYRRINENPVLQLLKRNPYVYRMARWAMNLKNLGNPLYWAGKEISREGYFFMVRWLTMTFVSQVGREAMRLYSGRHFQSEADRDAALVCYRLFALARQWGGPTDQEWPLLIDFVNAHPALDADGKMHILSRCSSGRFPRDLNAQCIQTEVGNKWLKQGLNLLLEKGRLDAPAREQLIRSALADLEN
ncbi:MAG: hypothetical protein AB9873_05050 [Syntrophobacteraceae bacterium]